LSTLGVNLIGDLRGDTGLSEAARSTLRALKAASVDTAYLEFILDSLNPRTNLEFPLISATRAIHPISIFHLNPAQMLGAPTALGLQFFQGRSNIGFWFWELADFFPKEWMPAFDDLDEIWVGSDYVKQAISRFAPIPVTKIPLCLDQQVVPPCSRSLLGLDQAAFVFVATFSAFSSIARKNPLGVIEAFKRAFAGVSDPPVLLMKSYGLEVFPAWRSSILSGLHEVGGILIERHLQRNDLLCLLASADVYVSLHRAEGFGLGIAEAMQLGKPVIATNYSGNTDFMNADNAYPVDFRLATIRPNVHRDQIQMVDIYAAGHQWAEPDLDHAAQLMQNVFLERDEAKEIGARAQQDIRGLLNPKRIGETMVGMLNQIQTRRMDAHQGYPPPGRRSSFPMTSIHAPVAAQQEAYDLPSLQDQFRRAFFAWEHFRQMENANPVVRWQIPLISRLARVLERLRLLGRLSHFQHVMNSVVLQLLNIMPQAVGTDRTSAEQQAPQSASFRSDADAAPDLPDNNTSLMEAVRGLSQEIQTLEMEVARLRREIESIGAQKD
jgi:glycosyltransferase involved in cell wall biosynthesis